MNFKQNFNLIKLIFIIISALLIVFPSHNVYAHALQPAFLNLREQETGQFQVLWKVPYVGEGSMVPLDEQPQFPDTCQPITPQLTINSSGLFLTQVTINCGENGLYGKNITILGLETALNDVLFRLETLEGETYSTVLRASNPSYHIPAQGTRSQIAWSYLVLGIKHILTGYDHLLFVLGLVLLVSKKWLLFKTITAFTVAHSITLGAATLGIVKIPQTPTEAVIALSILFLAGELAHRQKGRIGLTERYPWLVALIFGLLHGLGFAGALTEVGLPQVEIPLALLLFNLGVEVGQLLFIAVVLSLLLSLEKIPLFFPNWTKGIAPYAIGSLSAFWVINRITAF